MTIYKNSKKLFCSILVIVHFLSCGNKEQDTPKTAFNLPEKTLPHQVALSFSTDDSMLVLSDDMTNQLLQDIKKHEGIKIIIQTPLPAQWGVEYKLTPMFSEFDIWIISNLGDPAYTLLATVTTTETPSVIQSIPIAYNAAIEKSNYIESEQWTALITEDYKIIVTKSYEKLYSLTDSIENKETIHTTKEDSYTIEHDGRITYEIPVSFTTDYRAIIQFADTAIIGNVLDENWLWNTIEIQETAEDSGILFLTATTLFDKLSVYNYHGEKVDIIDISSFLTKHNRGYLALKKGQRPFFIPYTSAEECLQKSFSYFESITD
jgi:hypothetical protein